MLTTTGQKTIAFAATMIVVVAGLTALSRGGDAHVITVTARFPQTVGLYPGSSVRVLGVPVGTVRRITPDGPHVAVVMEIPADTPIPADATAVIIPPSLVSDRYVEFTPVYDGGARLTEGAVLDVDQTMMPVELDEVLAGLDSLLVALGPDGANKDGALGRLVDVGARTLGNGGGRDVHETITNLANAIGTLADNRGDLTEVITNLAAFTDTLARNDAKIRELTGTLARATQYLASERSALAASLKNLATALGEVASLVREHRAELGADIRALADITRVVVKHRDSLVEALDVLPLGVTNLASTVNTELGTLDIRNNGHQASDPYGVVVCWTLAPILGITCPPPPAATSKTPAARATSAAARAAARADRVSQQVSPLALLGRGS